MIVSELCIKDMVGEYHYPVMYREVLDLLNPKGKKIVVDCTTGIGSHSYKLLEAMGGDGFLIGIDKDQDSLNVAANRLKSFTGKYTFVKDDFKNLDKILQGLGIEGVDIFLFDLGISTYQLNNSTRGFSFLREGPLDMRMDKDSFLSAYDLVNNLSEIEIGNIFRKFGEERYFRRVARFLVEARKKEPISTTAELADIVAKAIPSGGRRFKIHPATRVFQSLRIVVNRELEALEVGLVKAVSFLNKGGRIGVISFHSLEDRIAKSILRDFSLQKVLTIMTKRPLGPTDLERKENSASRSAKLRVAEKT